VAAAVLAALVLRWQPGLPALPADVPAWEYFSLPPVPGSEPAAATDPAGEAAREPGLEVHVAAIGDGEAVLVRCPGEAALIGAGGPGDGPRVVAYLDQAGVHRLAALVVAHDAPYHVGGVPAVLARIPTRALYDAVRTSGEAAHGAAIRAVQAVGSGYHQLRGGDELTLGCGSIRALTPLVDGDGEDAPPGPLSGTGAALLIRSAEIAVLVAGALGSDGEEALTRVYPDLRVDALIVGGRGGDGATSALLLQRLRPGLAVIPVGSYNEEGRPQADVLARLASAGVQVYRTDRDGTVVLAGSPRGPRVRLRPQPDPPPGPQGGGGIDGPGAERGHSGG